MSTSRKSLSFEYREVPLGAFGSLKVRGLNVDDAMSILNRRGADILPLLASRLSNNVASPYLPGTGTEVAATLISRTPDLIADIVAQATDEAGAFESILRLPMGPQVELLTMVSELTRDTLDVHELTETVERKFVNIAAASLTSVH